MTNDLIYKNYCIPLLDLAGFNLDDFFGMSDDSNPLMMLIWILPIILFVFYGQRIQVMVSSNEIKKCIDKLEKFRNDTKYEFIDYLKKTFNPKTDPTKKLDDFFEYFSIMPVDLDPNGIVPKINHLIRSRDDFTRMHVKSLFTEISEFEITKVHNLLEIVTTLQMFHKATRHLYLLAKKQKNFPLILPLQMMIPFVMEEAEALKDAMTALKNGQPIGDGIGPMVVGGMMVGTTKQIISFQSVLSKSEYEGRKLLLIKAEGPNATVGRLGEGIEKIFSENKPDLIIMVDASLKLEGEDSASIAKGFGAAMGGIGTDRFQIEDVATKNSVPILAIVIKQSIHEALTLMTKEIADQASSVRTEIHDMIQENTQENQTVMVVGVGNTLGVSQ